MAQDARAASPRRSSSSDAGGRVIAALSVSTFSLTRPAGGHIFPTSHGVPAGETLRQPHVIAHTRREMSMAEGPALLGIRRAALCLFLVRPAAGTLPPRRAAGLRRLNQE